MRYGQFTNQKQVLIPEGCILFHTRAPVAIGTTLVSSKDLLEDGLRGKGVKIEHVYLDLLWFVHRYL